MRYVDEQTTSGTRELQTQNFMGQAARESEKLGFNATPRMGRENAF